MKIRDLQFTMRAPSAAARLIVALMVLPGVHAASAQTNLDPHPIDLPTVLRLANAQNLDVQIARQRLAQAGADYESAVTQFLPWLAPGITYRRHDNLLQDTAGNINDVHKDSYAPGLTLAAQVDLGDAIYKSLANRQNVRAAGHAVDAQMQVSILAAVQGYFDLVKAQARNDVARDAQKISQDLEKQVAAAVAAGIAYKGDELRVRIQTGQSETALRQTLEERRTAAARLAEVLHLDPAVDLVAKDSELVPITLVETNAALNDLVGLALHNRAELRQSGRLISAAESAKDGAVFGPLVPTVGGQAYVGGLGGGPDNGPSRFGESEDYSAFLFWRIGPGGLFDFGRNHKAESQLAGARLTSQKVRDAIVREVVEAATRSRSLSDQLETARRTLATATEAQKLAEQRKEFAVGVVLEDVQTQQELTRARNGFVETVAEFDKAQYTLQKAIGAALNGADTAGK